MTAFQPVIKQLTCPPINGGVYVGDGIAPKIVTKLKDGSFMEGFTSKGRYGGFLKGIRVSVALNPLAPLIGAASFAKLL